MTRGQNLSQEHQRRASRAQKDKHGAKLAEWGRAGYAACVERFGVDERGCLVFAVMGGTARMAHCPGGFDGFSHRQKRAARLQLAGPQITPAEWRAILAAHNFQCRDCGTAGDSRNPLCRDHKVPLALGGTNAPDNITVRCRSCNSRKHIRTDGDDPDAPQPHIADAEYSPSPDHLAAHESRIICQSDLDSDYDIL